MGGGDVMWAYGPLRGRPLPRRQRMCRRGGVIVQPEQLRAASRPLIVLAIMVQELHHRMVDGGGFGEVEDQRLALGNKGQILLQAEDIREEGRAPMRT